MDARNAGDLWGKLDQRVHTAMGENIMDGAKPPSDLISDAEHSIRASTLDLGIRKHLKEELNASQGKVESLQMDSNVDPVEVLPLPGSLHSDIRMTEPIDPADVPPLSGRLCTDIQLMELVGNQSTPHSRELKDSVRDTAHREGTLGHTEANTEAGTSKNAKRASKRQRHKMKKVLTSTMGEVEPKKNVEAARGTESTKVSTRDRKPTESMGRRANSSQIPTQGSANNGKQRSQSSQQTLQDPIPDREQMKKRKEVQKAFKEAEKKWNSRQSSEFKIKFQFHDNMFMMYCVVQGMSRWLLHQLAVSSGEKRPMKFARIKYDSEEQVKGTTDACAMILHEATKVFGNFSLKRISELIEAEDEFLNGRVYVRIQQLQGAHVRGVDARTQSPTCSFQLYTRLLYWKARMQLEKIVELLPSYNTNTVVKAELDKMRQVWEANTENSEASSEETSEEEKMTPELDPEPSKETRNVRGLKRSTTPIPDHLQVGSASTSDRGSTPPEASLRSDPELISDDDESITDVLGLDEESITEALGLDLYDFMVFWMSQLEQVQSAMLLLKLSEEI